MTEQITADVEGLGSDTCLGADENAPVLKMAERQDWELFRTVEGLQQKAGVPATRLRRLVLKELVDNGLDHPSAEVQAGWAGTDLAYVEDNGPGLDGTPEEIASLFSIRRPMRSSKLLRLPQRGALGNGLRVVSGAVLASSGSLAVITRNLRVELRPEADGSTTVVSTAPVNHPRGTRVEVGFGLAVPRDVDTFAWAQDAIHLANHGKGYDGRSSPFWYDASQFHELLLAHGPQPLRGLVAQLDGCTGAKAGEIVAAAGLDRMPCNSVNRQQATALLQAAREYARPVSAERLGAVGRNVYPGYYYAIEHGNAFVGSAEPRADIPFVVEAWATKLRSQSEAQRLTILVNRTPVPGDIHAYRGSDKRIVLGGGNLDYSLSDGPTKGAFDIFVNVTTPFCPIVSDGKSPDLEPFAQEILGAVLTAIKKAQRAAPKDKRLSQKEVVLDNLDDVVASVSGESKSPRRSTREPAGSLLSITISSNIPGRRKRFRSASARP
jgi:hypothetical protein